MALYHYQIGFPTNMERRTGTINVTYSNHAKDAARNDRYGQARLAAVVNLDAARLIEAEVNAAGTLVKGVYRMQYDSQRDIVLVLLFDGRGAFAKTVWFNLRTDKHSTLQAWRYARPEVSR
jgi:hypothetical protein